jgi:hypothetical protein
MEQLRFVTFLLGLLALVLGMALRLPVAVWLPVAAGASLLALLTYRAAVTVAVTLSSWCARRSTRTA